MSENSFRDVTHQSWLSRIGNAFKGILVGIILFLIAFPLLFWNEGRAVKRYKTLKEGGGAVVSITANVIDQANSGKLVHLTGGAEIDSVLTDSTFGVSANALKLKRIVEMYQWKETSQSKTTKKTGGGTKTVKTYDYKQTWSKEPINSTGFKKPDGHQNPSSMPYRSTEEIANDVSLEAFTLSSSLVKKINNYESLPVENAASIPEPIKEKIKLHAAGLYIGADPFSTEIGDVRITFQVAKPTQVSVISKQAGSSFEPYSTQVGGTIELLQVGVHTADAMFQKAQDNNKVLTWVLRLVGFILMLLGLNLIFKPLSVIADVLPLLGYIVGAGTGIISFLLALVLSLITIAIAWIVYRPFLGIVLIAVAIGLTMVIKGKLKPAKTSA